MRSGDPALLPSATRSLLLLESFHPGNLKSGLWPLPPVSIRPMGTLASAAQQPRGCPTLASLSSDLACTPSLLASPPLALG